MGCSQKSGQIADFGFFLKFARTGSSKKGRVWVNPGTWLPYAQTQLYIAVKMINSQLLTRMYQFETIQILQPTQDDPQRGCGLLSNAL